MYVVSATELRNGYPEWIYMTEKEDGTNGFSNALQDAITFQSIDQAQAKFKEFNETCQLPGTVDKTTICVRKIIFKTICQLQTTD